MAVRLTDQTRPYDQIRHLNQEWARLVGRHRGRLPWTGSLGDHDDLAALLAAVAHRPDPLLGALLRESAAGDLLAARTVLQAMLGKVVRLAREHPDIGVDEFVAALWCRIRTYPLDRRPTSIAANLALDTRKDVLADRRRDRESRLVLGRLDRVLLRVGPEESTPVQARWLIEAAEHRAILDPATASVLRVVYLEGLTGRAAAARLGTSAGMVRYRCSRGVRALARHASELTPDLLDRAA